MLTNAIILTLTAIVSFALGYGYAQQKHSPSVLTRGFTETPNPSQPAFDEVFDEAFHLDPPHLRVITNEDLP